MPWSFEVSQLLKRIEDRLLTEADVVTRACLELDRACYLIRTGNFDLARKQIALIRADFGDGRSGPTTCRLMLAEALLLHYEQLSPLAIDRLRRALLLAEAMKQPSLAALLSAWLAHFEFEFSNFLASKSLVKRAFEISTPTDHATRARVSIVMFNALSYIELKSEAMHWFRNGREHALTIGDQASIDALLHSKMAYSVNSVRLASCSGTVAGSAVLLARAEVSSAMNLQNLVQIGAHAEYVSLCDARLKIVEGSYHEASELLQAIRHAGKYPSGNFNQFIAELEIAYCAMKTDVVPACNLSDLLENSSDIHSLDSDDAFYAAWLQSELASRYGSPELAHQLQRNLEGVRVRFELEREHLRQAFSEVSVLRDQ
jgi:hypothetical protein